MTREELAELVARIRPGRRVGGEPADEAEHFMACPVCGQAIDKRDLGQVFHHDDPDHEPLPVH